MRPTLIVFLGGFGSSDVERDVDSVRIAAAHDAIDAWLTLAGLGDAPAIIVTDDPDLRANAPAIVDHDTGPFYFGRRLAAVIDRHNVESCVYMSGGSVPLFRAADFAGVAARLATGVAVTNNLYSSDVA